MIKNELFIGAFTGTLSTFATQDGRRMSFKTPLPRVEKGRVYNLQLDSEKGTATLIPVVAPQMAGL